MTKATDLPNLTAEEEEQFYTREQSAEMAAALTAEEEEEFYARQQSAIRMAALSKKDAAMLGDSGYERIEADHYCTPPENVDCLLQHVAIHENVWECAAGKGDISQRLVDFGHNVWSSDIHAYGFEDRFFLADFLTQTELPDPSIRAIASNPPYIGDMPEQFIRHALKLMKPVRGQVAMFLRNEYDCSKGRMDLFGLPPFHKKIVVTKRPRWVAGSTGSPRHNYSWFVWDWRHKAGAAGIAYANPQFAPGPVSASTTDILD